MLEINEISANDLLRIRRDFYVRGMSIADWARANATSVRLTYLVMSGKTKASRGKTHAIAVKLGLKPARIVGKPTGSGDELTRLEVAPEK